MPARRGALRITNKQDFTDLKWLRCSYSVLVDGVIVERGEAPLPQVAAGESAEWSVPYAMPTGPKGAEVVLDLTFKTARATNWSERGFSVAHLQVPIAVLTGRAAKSKRLTNAVEISGESVSVGAMTATFGGGENGLTALTINGLDLIESGPALSLFRAPTDNDEIRPMKGMPTPAARWRSGVFR